MMVGILIDDDNDVGIGDDGGDDDNGGGGDVS